MVQTIGCTGLVDPPIGRPDPDQAPPKPFQYGCPHTIAITRSSSAMVGGSVAFNSNEKIAGTIRMDNPKVDTETRDADLRYNRPPPPRQLLRNSLLKR